MKTILILSILLLSLNIFSQTVSYKDITVISHCDTLNEKWLDCSSTVFYKGTKTNNSNLFNKDSIVLLERLNEQIKKEFISNLEDFPDCLNGVSLPNSFPLNEMNVFIEKPDMIFDIKFAQMDCSKANIRIRIPLNEIDLYLR
jgi:hypothetical protein